jgi:hypothetical protein
MNEELNKALKSPDVAARLAGQGITVIGGAPEVARTFIDTQVDHLDQGGPREQHQGGLRRCISSWRRADNDRATMAASHFPQEPPLKFSTFRRAALALLASSLLSSVPLAHAQGDWPQQPVTLIMTFRPAPAWTWWRARSRSRWARCWASRW